MKQGLKYSTLLSLYIAQSIPMSFFSTVLPVIMRIENYSLESIGLIQLIKIPWILKFLWAPMVDNNSVRASHYKKWIFSSELFYAATIVAIGFFNLQTSFSVIIVLMVIAFIFSATQDIASDAFAVRILKHEERGIGNGIQASGSFIGTLFGSGVLLMLYSTMGWQNILLLLGLFVTAALIPLLFYNDKDEVQISQEKAKASIKDLAGFFKIPGIGRRILLLIGFYAGLIGILSLFKPFMVDLEYEIEEIAFISGIYGTAIGAISALFAGFMIRKFGVQKIIRIITGYNVIAASFAAFISTGYTTHAYLYAASGLIWSAYAMSSAIVYTISMEKVRSGKEGSDYTLQIVITHISSLFIAVMSGKLADMMGYTKLFTIESIIALLMFVLVGTLYVEDKSSQLETESVKE